MSSTPTREPARRVLAAEYSDAGHEFQAGDGEQAPSYNLLPTGQRANRVFVVGTLTETDDIGSSGEYWRGRVVDPTGTFFVYAGQYQPEAMEMLRSLEPPEYVAVVGKTSTYETEDGEVLTSIQPERITMADADQRDRWVAEAAEATVERLRAFTGVADEDTIGDTQAEDIDLAQAEYGENISPYKQAAIEALESLEEGAAAEESSEGGEQAAAD